MKDIRPLQLKVLEIAKVFHVICIKHKIPYYMGGGGLLGAVRHGGFIPWDDDLDFLVPREYYATMMDVLKTGLPKQMVAKSFKTEDTIWGEIVKIEDTTVEVKEKVGDEVFVHGAFIDIFPLDYTNDSKKPLSRNWMIRRLLMAEAIRRGKANSLVAKTAKILAHVFGKSIYIKMVRSLVAKHGQFQTSYWGAYGERETVPSYYWGTPKLYDFEDTKLYGIEQYDLYLKHDYGDYMQLPPEEKRKTHIVDFKILDNK